MYSAALVFRDDGTQVGALGASVDEAVRSLIESTSRTLGLHDLTQIQFDIDDDEIMAEIVDDRLRYFYVSTGRIVYAWPFGYPGADGREAELDVLADIDGETRQCTLTLRREEARSEGREAERRSPSGRAVDADATPFAETSPSEGSVVDKDDRSPVMRIDSGPLESPTGAGVVVLRGGTGAKGERPVAFRSTKGARARDFGRRPWEARLTPAFGASRSARGATGCTPPRASRDSYGAPPRARSSIFVNV
jgi:hypothetical protein